MKDTSAPASANNTAPEGHSPENLPTMPAIDRQQPTSDREERTRPIKLTTDGTERVACGGLAAIESTVTKLPIGELKFHEDVRRTPRRDRWLPVYRSMVHSIFDLDRACPVVEAVEVGSNYFVIDGGCVLIACELLGYTHIYVRVHACSLKEARQIHLIRNINRAKPDALETTDLVADLLEKGYLAHLISTVLGCSYPTLCTYLALIAAPPELLWAVEQGGHFSAEHAAKMIEHRPHVAVAQQSAIISMVNQQVLSVAQLEEYLVGTLRGATKKPQGLRKSKKQGSSKRAGLEFLPVIQAALVDLPGFTLEHAKVLQALAEQQPDIDVARWLGVLREKGLTLGQLLASLNAEMKRDGSKR